jgi:3-phosphoglycerate kinase
VLLTSLGDKCGRIKMENSVRCLIPALQSALPDLPIVYLDPAAVNKAATLSEDLKEGTLYVAENLNFRPEEHSYVEPWVEPEDPNKPKEEEKKEAPVVVDLKKMSAAEKKKYEEEQKKRAEEELAKTAQRPQADIDREVRRQK